jgi:hypothetical protein
MRVGSLVKYLYDGDLGIILDTDPPTDQFWILWLSADGKGWQLRSELEVVCE